MFAEPRFPDPTSAPPAPPVAVPATSDDAAAALAELRAGNLRFAAGAARSRRTGAAAAAHRTGQRPIAAVLGCIDARIPVEAVFDQDAGALCVVRSAGHVLDRAILGSVEFTVTDLAVPLVLVLGHEDCRAVAAAVDAARGGRRPSGSRGYLVDEIGPAVVEAGTGSGALDRATRSHVRRTVARLRRAGTGGLPVEVVGAVYQLDTGRVEFL